MEIVLVPYMLLELQNCEKLVLIEPPDSFRGDTALRQKERNKHLLCWPLSFSGQNHYNLADLVSSRQIHDVSHDQCLIGRGMGDVFEIGCTFYTSLENQDHHIRSPLHLSKCIKR